MLRLLTTEFKYKSGCCSVVSGQILAVFCGLYFKCGSGKGKWGNVSEMGKCKWEIAMELENGLLCMP